MKDMIGCIVGGTNLPLEVERAVAELVRTAGETNYLRRGSTAMFWDLVRTATSHLGENKQQVRTNCERTN